MARKNNKQENILDDEIYEKEGFPVHRIIITALILIPLGFMLNFPVKDIIREQVTKGLSSNTKCPILYSDIEVSYFFPKIVIKSPTITKQCINSLEGNLTIEDIVIRPHLPSFKLPGIRLSVNIKKDKTNLFVYPVIGLNKMMITVDDSIIHSDIISNFTGGLDFLDATFNLSLNAHIVKNRFKNASIKLESRNLYIKASNVNNFIIPQIPLMDFSLRAKIDKNMILDVAPGNLIIGDKNAPIHSKLGGTLRINNRNFGVSNIDMNGEMVLTNKFLDMFPIIRLKIQSPSSDGSYNFIAKGPLSSPNTYSFR